MYTPFFYFVFTEKTLGKAPQTIFAALRLETDRIGFLQNNIVSEFPNISVIDMTHVISGFARVLKKLSLVVRLFAALSIAAGALSDRGEGRQRRPAGGVEIGLAGQEGKRASDRRRIAARPEGGRARSDPTHPLQEDAHVHVPLLL